MEKNYHFLDVEVNKPIYRKLSAIQYDNNSRYILVSIYSNFKPYDLTYATVKIYGIKKDKTVFFNNAKILDAENGKFEIDLTEQCLAVDGDVEIQIIILGANKERLSSNSFIVNVKKTLIDSVKVTSQDQWGILTEGLANLAEYDIYKNNVFKHDRELGNLKYKKANVLDFGATADGVTDDTLAIKKAIDSIQSGTIFFPAGNYLITETIVIQNKNSIEFLGVDNATKLIINSNQLKDGTRVEFFNSKNIKIAGIAVESNNSNLQRINLYGELTINNCENVDITNITISKTNGVGLFFLNSCKKINITHCKIFDTEADGIHINRGCKEFKIDRKSVV